MIELLVVGTYFTFTAQFMEHHLERGGKDLGAKGVALRRSRLVSEVGCSFVFASLTIST